MVRRAARRNGAGEPPRERLNIYGGSDYAVTSHGGDYTVHVVIGVDPENRMYLLDLWRGHAMCSPEHLCALNPRNWLFLMWLFFLVCSAQRSRTSCS